MEKTNKLKWWTLEGNQWLTMLISIGEAKSNILTLRWGYNNPLSYFDDSMVNFVSCTHKNPNKRARRRFLFLLPIFKIGAITSIIIIIAYGKYSSGKYIHWVHAHANTFLMAAELNHFNWVELEEANVCVPVQLNSKLERAKKRTLEKNIKNSNAFDIHLSIL